MDLFDVIIIGGGPAGLNAAVVLGRCRRSVIVFDSKTQRNIRSHGMHNYLTRDDIKPQEFLKLAQQEAKKYHVVLRNKIIHSVSRLPKGHFAVRDENGNIYYSKKILIATGLTDNIPNVAGMNELYGKSVFQCPYCDAWEFRDKKLGVYARNKNGFELALSLATWSYSVSYFSDGRNYLKREELETLKAYKIPVINSRLSHLVSKNDKLTSIAMKNGESYPCDAIFFVNGYEQQCNFLQELGCIISSKKVAVTNKLQQTNIPGVYVAGDASKDMHFVVVAAAEGAKAGVTINKELQKELRDSIAHKKTRKK